jgi:2-keto-4-pentenoate hydratase/2-oxohepta-3-ene-1,7-dioic acid hydratase in catechol pathway
MKPPRYLQPGDVLEMEITGLGARMNRIVDPSVGRA